MKYSFDWDAKKEISNRQKHRTAFRQAATVFEDPCQITIYDEKHSQKEDRWITLGLDSEGIVRVVVHTFDQLSKDVCKIRIISARKANKSEVFQYQEGDE
ncbi:MAG: BrnT family toxin [Cyanobacteria bacterium J06634_5]